MNRARRAVEMAGAVLVLTVFSIGIVGFALMVVKLLEALL